MKCPKCQAVLTSDGKMTGPVVDRRTLEADAWVMDTTVKCWCCGYEYKPQTKPLDLPKLHWHGHQKPKTVYEYYGGLGWMTDLKHAYMKKIRGRKIDDNL
jgi:hypothetical protein